jgi:spore germination protein GerM
MYPPILNIIPHKRRILNGIENFHPLPYYDIVAVRKTNRKTSRGDKPRWFHAAIIFWLVFIIVIAGIFLAKRDVIENNFRLFMNRLSSQQNKEEAPPVETDAGDAVDETADEQKPILTVNEPAQPPLDSKPENQKLEVKTQPAVPEKPAVKQPDPPKQEPQKPAQKPVETRDRNVYFSQVDNDSKIISSRVSRKIAVSDTPLHDSINALLAGPTAEERNRGIASLIPPKTRLLTAIVRGTTAYVSFSEDFIFNTYGVEGFIAQIREVVWTATEFPTVDDVQILIEGRRVDYLGEGVWIGSPINRQTY